MSSLQEREEERVPLTNLYTRVSPVIILIPSLLIFSSVKTGKYEVISYDGDLGCTENRDNYTHDFSKSEFILIFLYVKLLLFYFSTVYLRRGPFFERIKSLVRSYS